MPVVVLQVIGWLAFVIGALAAGTWLRRHPSKENAERASRAVHGLFFAGLVIPNGIGSVYPGLGRYDRLLGVAPLPRSNAIRVSGGLLLVAGLYLVLVS